MWNHVPYNKIFVSRAYTKKYVEVVEDCTVMSDLKESENYTL